MKSHIFKYSRQITVIILSFSLMFPMQVLAFDFFTVLPIISKFITGKDNERKSKIKKKELVRKLTTSYEATHETALEELAFLAGWQDVSARASAISTIVDRLIFLGPMADIYQPYVKPDLFLKVLSVAQAEAINKQCKALRDAVNKTIPEVTKVAFNSAQLRTTSDALYRNCTRLSDYRQRVEKIGSGSSAMIGALPIENQNILEANLMNLMAVPAISISKDGEIVVKDLPEKEKKSGHSKKLLNEDQKREAVIASEAYVSLYLEGILNDIQSDSLELQTYSFAYLGSLFNSMKKAQIDFAKSIDKEASGIVKVMYPTVPWTTTVTDILNTIKKDSKKEDVDENASSTSG